MPSTVLRSSSFVYDRSNLEWFFWTRSVAPAIYVLSGDGCFNYEDCSGVATAAAIAASTCHPCRSKMRRAAAIVAPVV